MRQGSIRPRRNPLAHPASAVFVAAIVVSPQLLGGAFGWALCTSAMLVGLSLLLLQYEIGAPSHLPWSPVLLTCLGVWTALQLLPLPCSWVAQFSPENVSLTRASMALVGSDAPRCSFTYAPAATRKMLLLDFTVAAAALVATELSRQGRSTLINAALAASAGLMSLIAIAHWVLGARALFGWYAPQSAAAVVMAPLLNGNHLAGFLAFGTPFLLHFGRRRYATEVRWLAGASVLANAAVVGLTGSRSGAMAFAAAILIWHLTSAPSRRSGRRRSVALMVLGGASLVLSALLCFRTSQPIGPKPEMVSKALGYAWHVPLVGVGRGAFSSAFVRSYGTQIRAVHAENLLADYAVQWGLVVFACAAAAFGLLAWTAVRRSFRAAISPALIACVVIVLHDLADFSLQMPGVAIPAAAAFGSATARVVSPISLPRRRYYAALVAALGVGVAALGVVWMVRLDRESPLAYRRELERLRSLRESSAFHATVQRAISDYPAEPLFVLVGAAEAIDGSRSDAPAWINRALELAPYWVGPHFEAARWLLAKGRVSQAALELNEAASRDLIVTANATCELARNQHTPDFVLAAAPPGPQREMFLNVAVRCLGSSHPIQVAVDATTTPHGDPEAIARQAKRLAESGRSSEAEALLRAAHAANHHDSVFSGLAYLLLSQGRFGEVVDLTGPRAKRVDRATVFELRARAFTGLRKGAEMRAAVDQLREVTQDAPGRAAGWLALLGELEERLGNKKRALEAYERASWLDDSATIRKQYARLAADLGMVMRAKTAYDDLCAGPPRDEDACSRLEALRSLFERPAAVVPLRNRPSQETQ